MLNIRKNLVSKDKYDIKCPYSMTPTRIVVHNTANDASADNEIKYMIRNNNKVSFHYAVDDKEVVQGIEENRNSWNAGDGLNGKGNREGIAIEICYSKSGGDRFLKSEDNAILLIKDILKRYNWSVSKVTKHQDYSGKYCPHRTLDLGWDRFLNKLNDITEKEDVKEKEETKEPAENNYKGSSIVDALKSIGVDSSFSNRKKIAELNNIKLYKGLPNQNITMLRLFKENKLIYNNEINQDNRVAYTGTSIVDALKSIGVDSSFSNRKKIALKNGITNYKGTANQNEKLLKLFKENNLKF